MTKVGASCLSFGLFFSSEFDNLNMKMPGLWPVGTEIYKWDVNRRGYAGNRRNTGYGSNYQGSISRNGQRHHYQANRSNRGTQQRQFSQATRDYRYRSPDQQPLHDQYV